MANTDYEQMARDLISNISYTNKDFRSIYPELIDLVKKLTNKWDPEITNESDPGLILLKLNAIIADKNNYNIDKNILEAFPLSVTQYGNARKIYDILGYKMKWYQSATTTLSMVNNYGDLSGLTIKSPGSDNIIFPIFTMFSNDSGDNVYTLIKPVTTKSLAIGIPLTELPIIEGTNYTYELNGDTLITLNSLDADLRLYFKEPYVAENGIFIKNSNTDSWNSTWNKVDNLAAETLNQKIFEFGVLPNSNICYIQFPQDIGNLIGDGLNIQYIISSGVKGNVSAKEINTCTVDIIATDTNSNEVNLNDSIIILNPTASTNGRDPETLDEAYRNYKKTVGTFNTLVTCRDYENYIYNEGDGINNLVSNIVVSDRTNDFNSIYVQTDENNVTKKQFVKATYNDTNGNSHEFTAYDLDLATLEPVNSIYDNNTFDATFNLDPSTKTTVEDKLQVDNNISCIQHDYVDNTGNQVVLFKNKFTINAKILTYYKLSNEEIKDLKKQIQQALRLKYNSRELEFGESIAYDDLVNTIGNADSRIRTAIVDIPTYTTYTANYTSKTDKELSENPTVENNIYANMVMRGNTQLIDFNKDFDWQFGQVSASEYDGITSMTSQVTIPKASLNAGYELKENENIQVLSPSYITTQTISSYIKYEIKNDKTGASEVKFNKNVIYKITDNNWNLNFKFSRTLDDGTSEDFYFDSDVEYFKLNFDLTLTGNTAKQGNLQSSYKIESLRQNITNLDNKLCYWLLNNKDNILFESGITEKILDTNEYFIYTDKLKSGIVILGSGTKIKRSESGGIISIDKSIPVEQIAEKGVSSIPDSAFYTWGSSPEVTAHEMVIYTFGNGTMIKADINNNNVTNQLQSCSNLKYQNPGESEQELTGNEWQIRSRLNINATPSSPQKLGDNQTITLNWKKKNSDDPGKITIINTTTTDTEEKVIKSILFNENVQLAGGENIDTSVLDLEGKINYSLNALVFEDETNEIIPKLTSSDSSQITSNYSLTLDSGKTALIKLYVSGASSTNSVAIAKATTDTGSIKDYTGYIYNATDTTSNSNPDITSITSNGTYYLLLTGPLTEISLTLPKAIGISTTLDTNIYVFNALKDSEKTIKEYIDTTLKDTDYKFNYTYIVPDDIKVDNPIDPDSFWSSNHYCSRFTIAQLDLNNSNITIL